MRNESPQDGLPDLVSGLIREGVITEEQYFLSALSERLVLGLVLQAKMTTKRAYSLSLQDYKATALSDPRIHMLVLDNKISVEHALTIPRREADDDAYNYLKSIEERTPIQEWRFSLYSENRGISPYYVERIIFLKLKPTLLPVEKRELDLLLDPSARDYAEKIIMLEISPSRSDRDSRLLALLLNPSARPYATQIVGMEFKKERKDEDSAHLEKLYLKIFCKIPDINPGMAALREMISHLNLVGVRSHTTAFFQTDNPDALLDVMRRYIDHLIEKQIVFYYLNSFSIKADLRETEHMKAYISDKVVLFRFAILKYFVDHPILNCDDVTLKAVVARIQQKIDAKQLSFSSNEKILNLSELIRDLESNHTLVTH